MFEQIVTAGEANRARSVVLAVILQATALGILIIVPLLFVQQLPEMQQQLSFLVAPPPPPPPPPPPAGRAAATRPVRTVVTPKIFNPDHLTEPKTIPSVVPSNQPEIAPPEVQGGVPGGVPGGVAGGQIGGVLGGVIGGVPQAAPPPPPAPQQAETPKPTPERIRVGGQVEAAKLEHEVLPAYPALASQARVQGTVRLSAVIGKDGHVENLKVISGHPLLISSALDAVRQWVYQPTYLNSQPVEVQTEIDVNFQQS
jgi:periplasmic protein TonB